MRCGRRYAIDVYGDGANRDLLTPWLLMMYTLIEIQCYAEILIQRIAKEIG